MHKVKIFKKEMDPLLNALKKIWELDNLNSLYKNKKK